MKSKTRHVAQKQRNHRDGPHSFEFKYHGKEYIE